MPTMWNPFSDPDCPEHSPRTGKQCVVSGSHVIHGADFTDNWRVRESKPVEWDDGDTIVRGSE